MTNRVADGIGIAALILVFLIIGATILMSVPRHDDVMAQQMVPGADPQKADLAIRKYGCGTCHTIPGIAGANGTVGPDLSNVTLHSFLAGELSNTPDNLILWIQHPQQVKPGTAMPDMGVTNADARNIAAYLYSLH